MTSLSRFSVCFRYLVLVAAFSVTSNLFAAFTIAIDYSLDTENFFSTQERKDALSAVTSRFERVLAPSRLNAVAGNSWRIGFTHPGNGNGYQISSAASAGSDPLVTAGAAAANAYGLSGLSQDVWTLYAGGRNLTSAGVGGTGTGSNFTSTYNDVDGPLHRGLIANTPTNTVNDLPVWGGSIAFNALTDWHFDTTTVATGSKSDFYSIALHEVGHALGLATGWNQIGEDVMGNLYSGSETLAAYNADNGTNLTSLALEGGGDNHFQDGTYTSNIFALGDPNLVGTVGLGVGQDLLMEPIANFGPGKRRFELTNTDVAQLRDIGWSTVSATAVPEPSSLALLTVVGVGIAVRRRRSMNQTPSRT